MLGHLPLLELTGWFRREADINANRFSVLALVVALLAAEMCVWAGEIHDAVEAKDAAKVTELLAADTNLVNAVDAGGVTPLHYAAGADNVEIAKLLISKGANVNKASNDGHTPLHWAASVNAAKAAALLLENGADTSAKTKNDSTPFQVAVQQNAKDVVALLTAKTPAAYVEKALDSRIEQAEKDAEQGDLARAYSMYTQLLKEDPGNEKINFGLGMVCASLKDFSRAQLAFERAVKSNPSNDRARLELANTYMQLKELSAARREFETVLARNPPPLVRENIERGLQAIRQQMRRWYFSGRVDLGGFDDDNVNVGPDSAVINIAPIIFGTRTITALSVSEASKPARAKGGFAAASLSGAYDCGDQGRWLVVSDASCFRNWLDGNNSERESLYYAAAVGMRRATAETLLQLPVTVSHIDTGHEPLIDIYGFNPSLTYAHGRKGDWQLVTSGAVEARDYTELNDRDGTYASIGQTVRRYSEGRRSSISLALTLSHDFTEAPVYEYTGLAWSTGLEMALTQKSLLYARVRCMTSDYKEREILAPERRVDTQNQLTFGMTVSITGWWGIDASFQHTKNNSTFGLYQYERNVAAITTTVAF